ncbi:hypothetical protein [Roseiconus lacunae]|uniref:Uncharacterized protein n=1 Tax=Roseiconus lacunae TaxID=2605694 RepID=A0ABT7PHL1_9BACT|nr:hypothetical protein [Roseiconus lacunae]MDM4015981.1 hypothetical protein [Roseiconus lacunae]
MSDQDTSPVLTYQLEMLRDEFKAVNETIRAGDDITKSIKEWAITVWVASVGGSLVNVEFRQYIVLTAIVPLVFWMVDTWHRVIQRRFIWRGMRIMDFLNDGGLEKSFSEGRIVEFNVLDVGSRRETSPKFREFISWRRVMLFRTLSLLYFSLTFISITLWLLLLGYPLSKSGGG